MTCPSVKLSQFKIKQHDWVWHPLYDSNVDGLLCPDGESIASINII